MNKQVVTVIGLGYVGFPLACAIAKSNQFQVYGLVRDQKKADLINRGICPVNDLQAALDIKFVKLTALVKPEVCLPKSDFVIICVPTPIYADFTPDLRPIIDTSKLIAKYLHKGQTIILESTVHPGTCEEVILPLLEKSGLKGGQDFELSHCPERINPGDAKWNVYNIPRNVGSLTRKGNQTTANFYRSFLKAEIHEMENIAEAESTKVVENSFRDLNIAFVNELAISFDQMGINFANVLKASANKPFGFLPHFPGCGVGGHCIAVDPYYLIVRAKQFGFYHKLLETARQINNQMPSYTVSLLLEGLRLTKISENSLTIGILGVAYKPNIADVRESPALEIIHQVKSKGFKVEIYDPYVQSLSTVANIEALLKTCPAVILCTHHQLIVERMSQNNLQAYGVKVLIDGRNCLDKQMIESQGIYYKGIGI